MTFLSKMSKLIHTLSTLQFSIDDNNISQYENMNQIFSNNLLGVDQQGGVGNHNSELNKSLINNHIITTAVGSHPHNTMLF